MQLSSSEIERHLLKKGFEYKSGDHRFLVCKKRKFITTKVSHNKQNISDGLIGQMAKQIGLSKYDFFEFAKCRLSEEEYYVLAGI